MQLRGFAMIQIASIWKTIWNFATSLSTTSKNCHWTHKGDNKLKILSFNQLLNTIITVGQEPDCRTGPSKNVSLISFYNWRIILINSSSNSRQDDRRSISRKAAYLNILAHDV